MGNQHKVPDQQATLLQRMNPIKLDGRLLKRAAVGRAHRRLRRFRRISSHQGIARLAPSPTAKPGPAPWHADASALPTRRRLMRSCWGRINRAQLRRDSTALDLAGDCRRRHISTASTVSHTACCTMRCDRRYHRHLPSCCTAAFHSVYLFLNFQSDQWRRQVSSASERPADPLPARKVESDRQRGLSVSQYAAGDGNMTGNRRNSRWNVY